MKNPRTLLLDETAVKKLVGVKEAIAAVEKAFRCLGEGKVRMPCKIYLPLESYHGDFRAMPAYVEGFRGCSLKWVNVHPENKKKNLPTVMR